MFISVVWRRLVSFCGFVAKSHLARGHFTEKTKSEQVCLQNHIWVRTGCRPRCRLQEFSIESCGANPAVITAGVCLNQRPGCLYAEREAQQQEVGGPKVSAQEVGPFLLNKAHQSKPRQMLESVSQLCSRMLFIVSENNCNSVAELKQNVRSLTLILDGSPQSSSPPSALSFSSASSLGGSLNWEVSRCVANVP